ncbi:MAG: type II secretion system F family protein [Alphaproteobacteria bacterium]|nr:type II secretion system F family protein [Alphaproteobacteria bacterium]
MSLLAIIIIAFIVFIIIGMILLVVTGSGDNNKKKKLELIRGNSVAEKNINETDVQNKRRAEIAKNLKRSKQEEQKESGKITIALKMQQAGLTIPVKYFWVASIVLCLACLGIARVMEMSPLVTILLGFTGLFGLPRFVLKKLIQRRQKKFLQEFADALDATVRLLKAGMPVSEAILMISREFEGPVGEEMSIIYDKQKIGIPLHEAAVEGTKRMPIPEMQMFATGLAIQAQTGSSLSEILTNLSGVIRARFRLKRKIMALSSEAIASASIIGALPPLVALGLWAVSPGYLDPLFEDEFGNTLLTGAIGSMGVGVLVMKQMINFKI